MALRMSWSVGVLVATAALVQAQGPKPTPVEGKIRWVYSFEEGKRLAHAHDKPMFVVFRCER